jgi:lipopolysaccharide/colanic/teichoic acid biosynthesis glycosyltransferase
MQTEKHVKIDFSSVPMDISSFLHLEHKSEYRFLYIGRDNDLLQLLSNTFTEGSSVATFKEAQQALYKDQFLDNPVDVIFIDLHLDNKEFGKICRSIQQRKLAIEIPIIYNQERLTSKKINITRQLHLIEESGVVDDVVDLKRNVQVLADKITFLKQVKRRTTHISVFRQILKKCRIPAQMPISGKRVFDIVLSLLGILFLAPVFLLIALAIKLESRGPVFYISMRAGKGFKMFKFYKFRSMVSDADKKVQDLIHLNQYSDSSEGPKFFKINNDPRVTRLGRFLRKTSLDELPQLFNVLKGDMSLVGNRPLPLYEAETLTTNEFVERFSAPAGITGLWQVEKRGKEEMSTEERINLDISYAKKYSLLYDLRILAHTPAALFQKSNV